MMRLRVDLRSLFFISGLGLASSAASTSASASDAPLLDRPACGLACTKTFQAIRFTDVESPPKICESRLHLESLYLCLRVHCTDGVRGERLDDLNQTCQGSTGASIPPYDIVADYDDGAIAALPRFNENPDPTKPELFDEVALPADDMFQIWFDTLDASDYVYAYHHLYGWLMGWFWFAVVGVGMVNHALIYLETKKQRPLGANSSLWLSFKRHLNTPAMAGERCAQDIGGWGLVPRRVQSLTLMLFLALNIFCCVHGYRIIPRSLYFADRTKQLMRFVSDRTGIISFANFPLIWLFGMRNNLVIWLTGWDFGTYNVFHRWVARIATLQAVIHSVGYTAIILREGGWTYFAYWWTLMFWWAGELATVLMCAIVGFSFYWIRRRQYELFLILHIGLSILVLITMLGHVSIFSGRYDGLVWAPALIWVGDRLIRVSRIFAFNYKFWDTKAWASYNPATNMTRLEVPYSSSFYNVRPGTFYYLMMLSDSNFWESHPFTVATVSDDVKEDQKVQTEDAPLLTDDAPASSDARSEMVQESPSHMTFLIRPYDSFTSRLRDIAEANWPKSAPVRIIVEGPYGETLPLQHFDHILFVVGGSGIVVPLSYMKQLAQGGRTRSIHIHWATREPALVMEVLSRDFREALRSDEVDLDIYLTSGGGTDTRLESVGSQFGVEWHKRRLDASAAVAAAVEQAAGSSLAVVACGPAKMADDTRRAAVRSMQPGAGRIDYFEESFQW